MDMLQDSHKRTHRHTQIQIQLIIYVQPLTHSHSLTHIHTCNHIHRRSGSPIDGAPHRILHDQPIAVDDADLPLKLPAMTNFQPVSAVLFNTTFSYFALFFIFYSWLEC